MAKKAKPKSTARPKSSKANPVAAKAGTPDPRLHSFFRDLYAKPKLLQKFNSSPKARNQIIGKADLSGAHKALIKRGCVPEIIGALAGAPAAASMAACIAVIDCCEMVKCGHKGCEDFNAAAKSKTPKKTPKKK